MTTPGGRIGGGRTGSRRRGVVVLGMHRSGTSAATRLINLLGPATCAPEDMVRGPWNPSGHFESRSLMHLNNSLLAQMGRTWWFPPPTGDAYAGVAAGITTTHAQARRAFRRVHRAAPWVWKDPRTSVLLPFWRGVLGPGVVSVVVFRNPLDVAVSLQRRHSVSLSFGVALWERYNRLILSHSAGMSVLVSRYDDIVADPVGWSGRTREFLAAAGLRLDGNESAAAARGFVDPELRHSTHTPAELRATAPAALEVYDALEASVGTTRSFTAPDLPAEPAAVEAELESVGPGGQLAWNPPPWAQDSAGGGGTASGGSGSGEGGS